MSLLSTVFVLFLLAFSVFILGMPSHLSSHLLFCCFITGCERFVTTSSVCSVPVEGRYPLVKACPACLTVRLPVRPEDDGFFFFVLFDFFIVTSKTKIHH